MTLPKRKEIRLDGFDYSEPRYYFVTVCTGDKKFILGNVVSADVGVARCATRDPWDYSIEMPHTRLSKIGKIVSDNFQFINGHLVDRRIDCFCIMPNHVHFIVEIQRVAHRATPTLAQIIKSFKEAVTKQSGVNIWQRNYYEHIIRSERELNATRKYILENPLSWEQDEYFIG